MLFVPGTLVCCNTVVFLGTKCSLKKLDNTCFLLLKREVVFLCNSCGVISIYGVFGKYLLNLVVTHQFYMLICLLNSRTSKIYIFKVMQQYAFE